MFSPAERERLREQLVTGAKADPRVSGAALVGSSALGREDRWSDIDLALRLGAKAELEAVVGDWTEAMYAEHAAVHHTDVRAGAGLYRVFLLSSTLQVDLSFWPPTDFAATGPAFRLLFGPDAKRPPTAAPDAHSMIGMAWLYALHARSSLARERVWQAEYMISGLRDQTLALACARHGLATAHGRGFDQLPSELRQSVAAALPRSLETGELQRAFAAAVEALLSEARHVDPALAGHLAPPLRELARSRRSSAS